MNEDRVVFPRHIRRWLAGLVAVVVVSVLAGGYLTLANVYMPLTVIAGTDSDATPGNPFIKIVTNPDPWQGDPEWDYCALPNTRLAWAFGLQNKGSLPVTILGGDPGPGGPVSATVGTNEFSLVDLAAAPQGLREPLAAPSLAPTELAPGGYLQLWARYVTGPEADHDHIAAGGTIWQQTIWIRYSTLGIIRTAELPLHAEVAIAGSNCQGA